MNTLPHKVKILVTGASGLVGRHILDRLSMEKTISLVAQSKIERLGNRYDAGIACMHLELDSKKAQSILVSATPDIIVHCAAQIPTVTSSAKQVAEINRRIDAAVFSAADQCGAQVIFISGTNVYEGIDCPWIEGHTLHPFSPYAQQKYESEVLFSELKNCATSLRVSSPYGGRQNAGRNVLYKFIHAAMNGGVLKIYGAGSRRQDFIYATDISEAVWSVVLSRLSGKEVGGIFNIASGSSTSMRELAELIVDIAGDGTVSSFGEEDAQENFDPQVDIHKANEALGWKPSTSLASGIGNVISSIRA